MTEREIFDAAIQIPHGEERRVYLDSACGTDAVLREQVEQLLRASDMAGSFLATPAGEQLTPREPATDVTAMLPNSGINASAFVIAEGKVPLDFLQPGTRPGSLGRLAHYEVLEVLGQGAFGIVLKAFDDKLHRMVAIKVMNSELAATSPPRKRFLREAQSSARVRHENIVAIHAVDEQPLPYLVMEFIPGGTLQQRLDQKGPLDLQDILRIGQQIALGLAAAHAEGLIHRDIKPANILIESGIEERVKITDFGLARATDDASLTQSGLIAGTPLYMAPEQAKGQPLDHRTDLFSLGSVLYTMASGRPPFRAANTIAVLKRVCEDTPRPITEVIPETPQWLCDIISKLHAKEPDDRFQSAKEVADVLGQHLAFLREPMRAPRPAPIDLPVELATVETAKVRRPVKANGWTPTAVALAIIAGVLLIPVVGLVLVVLAIAIPAYQAANARIPVLPDVVGQHGLRFDGKDDYVKVEGLDWSYPQFTLEAFVNSANDGDNGVIAMLYSRGDKPEAMFLFDGPASSQQRMSGAGVVGQKPFGNAMAPLTTGVRQHRALVFDGQVLNYYVNGVWQGKRYNEAKVGLQWQINNLLIGCKSTDTEFFRGVIDQVRVSRVARYTNNFPPVTRLSADDTTLALYNFDEGAGDLLHDTSGHNHHAAIFGAKWVAPSSSTDSDPNDQWITLFNGRNFAGWKTNNHWQIQDGMLVSRVTAATKNSPDMLVTERKDFRDFHARMEVKINNGGDSGFFFRFGDQGDKALQAQITAAPTGIGSVLRETTTLAKSLRTIPPDTWTTLEVVAQGPQISVFVDGAQVVRWTESPGEIPAGPLAFEAGFAGTEIAIRKVEVKRLSAMSGTTFPGSTSPGLPKTGFDPLVVGKQVTAPLSQLALVSHPAKLPGIESWSIESRRPRSAITAVAYSPDGQLVAVGGYDGLIRLYDAKTQKLVRMLLGHEHNRGDASGHDPHVILQLAWTSDSRRLISTCGDFTARLWDPAAARSLAVWRGLGGRGLALSPDDKSVAFAMLDRSVQIYDVSSQKLVRTIADAAFPLAWSPEGNKLAFRRETDRKSMAVVDPQTGAQRFTLTEPVLHLEKILDATWTAGGTSLVTSSEEGTIRVWDGATGTEQRVLPQEGYTNDLAWNADRSQLACVYNGFHARLWDAKTWTEIRKITATDIGTMLCVAWSPDGQTLAIGDEKNVTWYDVTSGNSVAKIPAHGQYRAYNRASTAWSPDGTRLAMTADFGQRNDHAVLWNASTGKLERFQNDQCGGCRFAWSPDGRYLAAHHDTLFSVWDISTRERRQHVPTAGAGGITTQCVWSPNGSQLLISSAEAKTVQVWNPLTGVKQSDSPQQPDAITSANWSPDGKQIAIGQFVTQPTDGQWNVRFWEVGSGTERPGWTLPRHHVSALAWSPDGKLVAAGQYSTGIIRLWNTETAEEAGTLSMANSEMPIAMCWSPDGKTLVVNDGNRNLAVFDMQDRTQTRTLVDVGRGDVSFANGLFAAGEFGNVVRLWDLTGNPGPILWVHDGGTVQFSPQGHYRTTSGAEFELVYVVQTTAGQELLTPEQFAQRTGWKNDPTQVDRQLAAIKPTPISRNANTAVNSPSTPAAAPPPAVAPFDAAAAKAHQEAWAKHLGVPVEYTNSIGMKFRLIPPGEFLMGSTPEEIEAALKEVGEDTHWQECIQSEAPQHKVILTQPIYLGVNEVTQAEYEKVMGVNPSHFAPMGMGKEAVAGMETAEHPVEMVSWNDAAEFCAKLSQQEKLKPFSFRAGETITPLDGTGYRLPSEAEWEFACRAGTTSKYWIGDQDEDMVRAGWFATNSDGRTHAAGELKANPFGLSDIYGNVWEWVQDGWDASSYGQFQDKPATNPNSPFSASSQRVIRGGAWYNAASRCRSSRRFAHAPARRVDGVGFRVSLPVDAVKAALAKLTPAGTNTKPVAPSSAIAPFDAAQAKKHQEAWAKHLGVPVEYTNTVGMKFRLIPPGEFLMGTTPQDLETALIVAGADPLWKAHIRSEAPQRRVAVESPFYLGMHEVTQSQFAQVMNQHPSLFAATGSHNARVTGMETAHFPVEALTWDEAVAFCRQLQVKERLSSAAAYSLPQETQWEFACRAGTVTKFWTGDLDEDLAKAAWFNTNAEARPHTVGELKANPFGLHDMHGNVWEWMTDEWALPADAATVIPDAVAGQRVLRGGDWSVHPNSCRSSHRHADLPTARFGSVGFRVALSVEAVKAAVGTKDAPVTETRWQPLFNGKDLTGWKSHPEEPGQWHVENGVLVGSEKPSYLFSERDDFGDFHLRAEVQINGGGDGGIMLRSPFLKPGNLGLPGYEAQIQAGVPLVDGWATGAIGGSFPQTGWRILVPAAVRPKADERFVLEIIAKGNEVETRINGEKVAWYIDPDRTFTRGHIALQQSSPSTNIQFFKLEIRPLTP